MSMSTHIIGFRPPDEKWRKMKAVWDACVAADMSIPNTVHEFFGGESPDPNGVEVDLFSSALYHHGKPSAVKKWNADMQEGFEVDVTKLPKDVTIIRFYNSY